MNLAFEILLWVSLLLLFLGFIWDYHKHIHRAAGYVLYGLFWITSIPSYLKIDDYFNAFFTAIALPAFIYVAYHEYLSKKWDEDPEVMRFLAGGASIASLIYFGFHRIPLLSGFLIKSVTEQTVWAMNALGYDFSAGAIDYAGNPLFYRTSSESINVPVNGTNIVIILACTGLQAIAVAASFIYSTVTENIKKIKSLSVLIPTIYIANIFRNMMVLYLVEEGIFSFEVAHNQVAKTFSVLVMIVLFIVVFEIMPKFHDNIMETAKLPLREPTHQKQQERP
ncbi:MAG: archaeosortase A [Thermoplasmata archaeon]